MEGRRGKLSEAPVEITADSILDIVKHSTKNPFDWEKEIQRLGITDSELIFSIFTEALKQRAIQHRGKFSEGGIAWSNMRGRLDVIHMMPIVPQDEERKMKQRQELESFVKALY